MFSNLDWGIPSHEFRTQEREAEERVTKKGADRIQIKEEKNWCLWLGGLASVFNHFKMTLGFFCKNKFMPERAQVMVENTQHIGCQFFLHWLCGTLYSIMAFFLLSWGRPHHYFQSCILRRPTNYFKLSLRWNLFPNLGVADLVITGMYTT